MVEACVGDMLGKSPYNKVSGGMGCQHHCSRTRLQSDVLAVACFERPLNPTPTLQARASPPELWCSHPDTSLVNAAANQAQALTQARGLQGLCCWLRNCFSVHLPASSDLGMLSRQYWSSAACRALTLSQRCPPAQTWFARAGLLHTARLRTQLFFPDRRLIQFDCGKLQVCCPAAAAAAAAAALLCSQMGESPWQQYAMLLACCRLA